jgi:pyruvate dehydrogenase E2 component (dihydrolipoamide acetyltransferase)
MAIPVEVPKLGNTVEECLISKWIKRKGDAVSAGETVAEIETDKATFEVAAPVSGVVLETFFEEGALVPVFTNLFVIGDSGESSEAFRPGSQSGANGSGAAKSAPGALGLADAAPTQEVFLAPANQRPSLSPRARRFQKQHDFHPSAVNGSGPGGRVLEKDLRALYELQRTPSVAADAKRISGIREKIARRMRESLANTAQYTLHSWADAGGLLRVRARLKNSPHFSHVNINHLVCFCVVEALLEAPEINAEFIDGQIRTRSEVHLGFACDTPRGLLVPVVRSAQEMAIDELASRMNELASQAQTGSIEPDDLSGATFTVSNLGIFGVESFTPLLNPPQVAILGVGSIAVKPVRRGGGIEFGIEFIDAISLSLTCDHQVIDGAPGAKFLQAVREKIENVESQSPI